MGDMADYYSDPNDDEVWEEEPDETLSTIARPDRDAYGLTPEQHLAAYRLARNINPERGGLLIHHSTLAKGQNGMLNVAGQPEAHDEVNDLTEAERELDKARRRVDVLAKLASLDDDAVICWTRTFREDVTYSYVALKAGGYWYTTEQGAQRRSGRTLAEALIHADEGSLLVVTAWEPLTD